MLPSGDTMNDICRFNFRFSIVDLYKDLVGSMIEWYIIALTPF